MNSECVLTPVIYFAKSGTSKNKDHTYTKNKIKISKYIKLKMITYKIAIRMNPLNSNKNNIIFNFFKKKTASTVVNR